MTSFFEFWKQSKEKYGQTQYQNRAEWTAAQCVLEDREQRNRFIPIDEDLPENNVNIAKQEFDFLGVEETAKVLVKCFCPTLKLESYHIAYRIRAINGKDWRWRSNSNDFTPSYVVGWRII